MRLSYNHPKIHHNRWLNVAKHANKQTRGLVDEVDYQSVLASHCQSTTSLGILSFSTQYPINIS